MGAVFEDISAAVGGTPLVRLNKLGSGKARILVKLESRNPGASIKDRIAKYMIEAAERQGRITPQTVLVEPTSGNTGIGLAMLCAAKGIPLVLFMPESASLERRKLLSIFGARIILTPAERGMPGSIEKAEQFLAGNPQAVMLQQFQNPANPQAHRETTAEEIWADTDGSIDILVSAVGTGGTLTGCAEGLRRKKPAIRIVAVEPADSPVLSGGNPGRHKIQGIGAGFVPDVLKTDLIDEIVQVSNEDALETARRLASREGILAGISAGANIWAAVQLSKRHENEGKTVVTFICDTGERYISTELFNDLPEPETA
ncbi:MAG: cysteine synthase A [Phycisphaerae bacterium]|nr:cysteine synthase A [Phycisphaerae bacterium]